MKKFLFFIFSLIFFGAFVFFIDFLTIQPKDLSDVKEYTFEVKKGESLYSVIDRLYEKDFIFNAFLLKLDLKVKGLNFDIKPGVYSISRAKTPYEILEIFSKGVHEDVWVTIPEGYRVEEIAEALEKADLKNFSKQDFLETAKSKEGYLFPDTYLLPVDYSTDEILSVFLDNFDEKVKIGLEKDIKRANMSFKDIIILASIVQREAFDYNQMRLVAGILKNRLSIDMPLQVDATVQYAKGFDNVQNTWWPIITLDDLKIDSLYNTYLNKGLPPGPICNPGLDAIKAVLNPLKTDYLYYLHDEDGNIHPARTQQEHSVNKNKYLH